MTTKNVRSPSTISNACARLLPARTACAVRLSDGMLTAVFIFCLVATLDGCKGIWLPRACQSRYW